MFRILLPVLSLLLLFFYTPCFGADQSAARDAGTNTGNNVLNVYNSPDKLKDRAFTPLTSKTAPMYTINKQKSFTAQVSCPSSQKFVSISINTESGGDVTVDASQDIDMDGAVDFTNTFSSLSGICANGAVACNPGTWNNCLYWRWAVDSSLHIGLSASSRYSLGGCYCINNSCGGASAQNYTRIMNDLGGGIVGAIQAANPNYAITGVQNSASAISYYGQDTQKCQGLLQGGTQNLSQYANNPSGLDSAAQDAANQQLAQQGSAYNVVYNSSNSTGVTKEFASCSIKAQVSAVSTTTPITGSGSGTAPGGQYLFIRIDNAQGSGLYTFKYSPDAITWHEIVTFNTATAAGTLSNFKFCITPSAPGCILYNATSCTSQLNYSSSIGSCSSPPASISYNYSYTFNFVTESVKEDMTDSCASYSANTDCSLQEEKVDGAKTYISGQPTGATTVPSCKTVTGSILNQEYCRDWWEKDRVYYCKVIANYNVQDLVSAGKEPVNTATLSSDKTQVNYTNKGQANTAKFSDGGVAVGKCAKACMVKKNKTDTQISSGGQTTTDYLNSTDSSDVYYLNCTDSGLVCPNAADEEVITTCDCLDNFGEAASAMQALINASKDITCSQQ
ncbi:MAG: hypothetical protein HY265_00560 [Deltaproteobacteria bacterium]|nr:hypothetical protein [Deltaproteobacteria bacterium]